ncbi:MAG: hypothetical protein K6G37_02345, partial [Bacilli bacterium]|nr:hypothetical protein [Bacilli bacterium]
IIFFVFVLIGTLFIFGTNAKAGEDNLNVNIKSITLMEKSDNAEVLSEPSAEGLGINSNVKFLLVGDFVTYKVTFENKDSADYKINLNNKNEYFTFSLDNNVIKANSETELLLTIKYNKVVPQSMLTNEQLHEESVVSGSLARVDESTVADNNITITAEKEINNPKTGDTVGTIFLYEILLGVAILTLYFVKSAKKRMLLLTVFTASALCMKASADDTIMLKINSKIFVQSGLVYNGEVVHKSSIEDKSNYLYNQLLLSCPSRWDDNSGLIDMETPEQYFEYPSKNWISENAITLTFNGYLTNELDIKLSMALRLTFDTETGDSGVLVNDYNYDSSVLDGIDYTKLIYNNELLDRKGLEEIIESDSLKIGNSISNIGYDCAKILIGEPQVTSQQEI